LNTAHCNILVEGTRANGDICRGRGEMLKKDKKDRMIENKQRKGKKT
jgi:hypothetical protein